ncbi:MAG: peptide deformylase [Bacteroidia bacterium]|nr:peptide deformylase [Bacteroidia bacterium]
MIYPIVAYGDPVLRKKALAIHPDHPKLTELIDNMFKTMYHSQGVGLAAPQIGLAIRLFVIDASPFKEEDSSCDGFKKIFINAEILSEEGETWKFNEGCLSIPGIREDVNRLPTLTIRYQDLNFDTHTEEYTGIIARIIQHEYDHIEGILFTDKLSPLKKTMLKGRLNDISKGKVDVDYKMRFPKSR